jgi:tetratricopeptide (TPR) repeat protein
MFNIGLVHVDCCQYNKALEIFEETLLLQIDALGDFHVDVALTLESIGSIYEQRLKIDKALEMYHRALHIRQVSQGEHLLVALTMDKIGKCLMNFDGNVKEAMSHFDKSITIYRACGVNDSEPLLWEARKNYDLASSLLRTQENACI